MKTGLGFDKTNLAHKLSRFESHRKSMEDYQRYFAILLHTKKQGENDKNLFNQHEIQYL